MKKPSEAEEKMMNEIYKTVKERKKPMRRYLMYFHEEAWQRMGIKSEKIGLNRSSYLRMIEAKFDQNNNYKDQIKKAVDLAIRFGGIDESHHKAWVIDQMLRILLEADYDKTIKDPCAGEDGPNTYEHDVGIQP